MKIRLRTSNCTESNRVAPVPLPRNKSQPREDVRPPRRCAVCGTLSVFRVVDPGPPLDRLECTHCGAQRLEPPYRRTEQDPG